jgi:hypothetical protein
MALQSMLLAFTEGKRESDDKLPTLGAPAVELPRIILHATAMVPPHAGLLEFVISHHVVGRGAATGGCGTTPQRTVGVRTLHQTRPTNHTGLVQHLCIGLPDHAYPTIIHTQLCKFVVVRAETMGWLRTSHRTQS